MVGKSSQIPPQSIIFRILRVHPTSKSSAFLSSNILLDAKPLLSVTSCKLPLVLSRRKHRFITCGVEVRRLFYWETVIFFVDVGCIGVAHSGHFRGKGYVELSGN